MKDLDLATLAVHSGAKAELPDGTPSSAPIFNAVTYSHETAQALEGIFAGSRRGYVYSRFANPTVATLELAVAKLERTEAAVACASGMAALHIALLAAGARTASILLTAQDLYGGTLALLERVLIPQGIIVNRVDMSDTTAVASAIERAHPDILLLETISNPLLKVADLPALTRLAHCSGANVVVDNTFATPCLVRPADFGVDYVVESATKYLGGHGDVMAGLIAGSEKACHGALEVLKLVGSVLGPNEAWLLLRGLKTLVVRIRQQCRNAALVAQFLASHPRVKRIYYPGSPTHPHYVRCRNLFASDLYGAVVSFEIAGATQDDIFRFMDALQIVAPATSLGDVTSLLLYPAQSSHRALSEQERLQLGVGPNLVRLSVGIEAPSDITRDLARALRLSA